MSSKKTEVVFRRPKGSYDDHDPSTWDDTAIADAYDRAVNLKPSDVHETSSTGKVSEKAGSKIPEPIWEKSSGIFLKKETAQSDIKWKVGDSCVAKYSEDDLYYDAVIISIDEKNYSCEVEFTGYGNKELVSIHDVHHENQWKEMGDNLLNDVKNLKLAEEDSTSSSSETDSSMNESGTSSSSSSLMSNSRRKLKSNKHKMPPFMFPPPMMGYNSNFSMPQQLMPPWHNTFMPPPMPMFQNNSLEGSELSNMLMAWYMAGYQTGYYQGRQKKS